MTQRKDLLTLVKVQPRSISWLARALGLRRDDVEDHLRHALRSAAAAGLELMVIPARCRTCGFTFEEGDAREDLGGLFQSATELRDSDQLLVKARYRF